MKIKENYLLTEIENTGVLYPFGQNLADNRGIIEISGVGEFIAKNLQSDISRDELLECLYSEFEPENDAERDIIRNDMDAFLDMLRARKVLDESDYIPGKNELPTRVFEIADRLLYIHADSAYIDKALEDFEIKGDEAVSKKQPIDVYIIHPDYKVFNYETVSKFTGYNSDRASLIVGASHTAIYEQGDLYYVFPAEFYNVTCLTLNKHKPEAVIYLRQTTLESDENLFGMIKDAFFYYIHGEGKQVVHSSSIIYNGKAWLFSAESGVGKSTHVELWRRSGFEFEDFNGDNIVVYMDGDTPVAAGLPWSGTSGIYCNKTVPIGGIFFLKQAKENAVTPLTSVNAIVSLTARFLGPNWTREHVTRNIEIASDIVKDIKTFGLECNMDLAAAELAKNIIEKT